MTRGVKPAAKSLAPHASPWEYELDASLGGLSVSIWVVASTGSDVTQIR